MLDTSVATSTCLGDTAQGSSLSAGNNAILIADNQINLQAAQNTSSQASNNSSSNSSIGASISPTGGPSFNASASRGSGQGSGQDTSYTNTQVNAGNRVTLSSAGDTNLTGAVIAANTVNAQVGGNLSIESLQDTSTYSSRQTSSGGSISVSAAGIPIGGGISASRSHIDSNYQSTNQQSGINTGDGGFQVNVQGNTNLTGAVIASTEAAVANNANSFTTGGALTLSDVQNTASYTGTAAGVSVNTGIQGGQFGVNGVGAGVGTDRGSASSTTTAGISGIAGNTAIRTGDAQTGITPIFDAAQTQREIDARVQITQAFGREASTAWGTHANQMFVGAVTAGRNEDAQCWAPDGACRAGGHALIGGLTGGTGGAVSAGATSVAAPHMQAFLVSTGISPAAASAVTQLSALGAGTAIGGPAGGAAAINEAGNNAVLAIPLIVDGVIAGGALAARACLSSPACLNALRLGGTALVARLAATLRIMFKTPRQLA